MDGVLEHVVDEVGVGLYEIIEDLQDFQVLLLPLEESAECHVVRVEFNGSDGLEELLPVGDDGLVSFFHLLLLLEALKFLINLLLHHCVQVLLLDL